MDGKWTRTCWKHCADTPQYQTEWPEQIEPREAVYLDWLAERLSPGARLERSASRLARVPPCPVSHAGITAPKVRPRQSTAP